MPDVIIRHSMQDVSRKPGHLNSSHSSLLVMVTKIVPDRNLNWLKRGIEWKDYLFKKYTDHVYAKVQVNDYCEKLSSGLPFRIDS